MDRQEETDEAVLQRSVAKPDAFGTFYDRHASRVLAFFARRTLDADTAAELTGETFAEAFASRRRCRGTGPAAGWLYGIASHELSHFLRRRAGADRARRRLAFEPLDLHQDDVDRIEELIDFEGLGRRVAGELSRLPRKQREAVTLRVVEQRSYAELARTLGCSADVARARVSRGLRRLSAALGA